MKTKKAGLGAAIAVLLAVMGLAIIVAVILLMMSKGTTIDHSPERGGQTKTSPIVLTSAGTRVALRRSTL